MQSLTTLNLNLQYPNQLTTMYAVQNDRMTRKITANLFNGSDPFTPDSGAAAMIRFHKPDGTNGFYDVDDDGNTAVTWSGNVATIMLAEQALTCPGDVICHLQFYTGDVQRLTTFSWIIKVQECLPTDEGFMSTDYYNILSQEIAAILAALVEVPTPSTTNPLMDGTAEIGTSSTYARGDHRHPTDTSRASTATATTSANGLMSSSDKTKLNGIATGAEVNQNAFSNVKVGSTTVAADAKTDTLELVAGSNVTITPDATNDKLTIAATDTTYGNATTSAAGLMSASDKTKLNGIAEGAQVNSITGVKGNAESSYRVGNVNLTPANIGAVPTTRKINNLDLSQDRTLSAADVGAVPTSRKVNNKQLSSDITLAASDVGAAPTDHASTATTYGKGTSSNYGHVKISDSLTDTTTAATGGVVPSMKAVSDLNGAINNLTASDIANASLVAGADVGDALNTLNGAINDADNKIKIYHKSGLMPTAIGGANQTVYAASTLGITVPSGKTFVLLDAEALNANTNSYYHISTVVGVGDVCGGVLVTTQPNVVFRIMANDALTAYGGQPVNFIVAVL